MKERWMGLDYGTKTVGVAVSDVLGITAQGVETVTFVATRCSPFVRLPPAKVLISITLLPHFSSLSPIP